MSAEIVEVIPPEVLSSSAIESMERAQIDMQIATAMRYPKHTTMAQLNAVKQQMLNYATLDIETASSCFYKLPRGGKNIEGPSVRLAEIAITCYGNIQVGSRCVECVTSGDSPHVTIQAIAHDLERNVRVVVEKRRRITKKKNKDAIDEDDINLATNAGAAIAFRDAAFKVVPLALIKPVMDKAKEVAIGDASTLVDRRAKAIDAFGKMGVHTPKILARLGRAKIDDIDLSDLETLIGFFTAIKDGQATVDDVFSEAKNRAPIAMPSALPADEPEHLEEEKKQAE